ncbi:MAG: hypothetical protein L6302_01385 [Desulfobacteraceae bacterium]|nr:hypothetical protein [Desulfobacteraceae bacterium]
MIVNKSDLGDDRVEKWCTGAGIPIVLKIPFERRLAEGYARGKNLVEIKPALRPVLENLLKELTT